MKKYLIGLLIGLGFVATGVYALPVYMPIQGGTGTSTVPSYGQVLVGNSNGTYSPTATSSLGLTSTWGSITGTLSNQTDLNTALNAKVPTSRTLTINGTGYNLSADRSWTIPSGVNAGNQYQAAFYAENGSTVSGTSTLNIKDEMVSIGSALGLDSLFTITRSILIGSPETFSASVRSGSTYNFYSGSKNYRIYTKANDGSNDYYSNTYNTVAFAEDPSPLDPTGLSASETNVGFGNYSSCFGSIHYDIYAVYNSTYRSVNNSSFDFYDTCSGPYDVALNWNYPADSTNISSFIVVRNGTEYYDVGNTNSFYDSNNSWIGGAPGYSNTPYDIVLNWSAVTNATGYVIHDVDNNYCYESTETNYTERGPSYAITCPSFTPSNGYNRHRFGYLNTNDFAFHSLTGYGYLGGNLGLGDSTPGVKLEVNESSTGASAVRITRPQHASNLPSAFSLVDETNTETIGFSTWNGGGSANGGGYAVLKLGSDCSNAGCRFGEISPRDESSGIRTGGIIFEQGTTANSGRTLFYGAVGGSFTEGLRVSQTGLVSVKKGSDAVYPFDVTGAGRFTSFVDASNFVATSTTGLSTFAGRVGIGTTSPYAKLSVVGETVAEKFTATSTTATSTFAGILVVPTGKVGIGTINPNEKLTISGGGFQVSRNDGGLFGDFTNNVDANFQFSVTQSGVADKFAIMKSTVASALAFGTNNTERARISSAGFFGVGTSSPTARLHVYPGANSTKGLIVQGDNNASANIQEWQGANGTLYAQMDKSGIFSFGKDNGGITVDDGTNYRVGFMKYLGQYGAFVHNTASPFTIFANSNADIRTAGTLRTDFIIDGAGNVGISTSSPYAKLSVAGTVVSSNMVATSTVATSTFAAPVSLVGSFGEIYVHDASTTAQTIAAGSGYVKSTAFTNNGLSSGSVVSDVTNDKILITRPGKYKVNMSASFSNGGAVTWTMAVLVGGAEQQQIHSSRKLGATGDVGSLSASGFITATSSTNVELGVQHDAGVSQNITIWDSNLNVVYVGE